MAIGEISPQDLSAGFALLIDVREPDEYRVGHVPGAINVPLSELPDRVADCTSAATVHLVCQSGGRSLRACEFLSAQPGASGTTFVNVSGGTKGWIALGHEVVTGDSPR